MNRRRFNPFRRRSASKPADALPLKLRRKRIYILPTRHGAVFILVLLAMLIGSINYKNNLGFLLTFLLGSMAFVSIFHTYRNLSGIHILSVTSKPVFSGDRAMFNIHLRLDEPARAAVEFSLSSAAKVREDLDAVTDNWIQIPVVVRQRGLFGPGPLKIVTRYPLGLFRAWSTLHPDATCLVYPAPLPGPLIVADDMGAVDGDGDGSDPGAEDFKGLKSYQPGDPLQHIAWKAYSRGQGLFTKMFVGEAGATAMLDWNSLGEPDAERKLSRLCDMVLRACRRNLVFGLKLPGKTIEPDRGEAHRQKCLQALAMYTLPDST